MGRKVALHQEVRQFTVPLGLHSGALTSGNCRLVSDWAHVSCGLQCRRLPGDSFPIVWASDPPLHSVIRGHKVGGADPRG